MLFLKKEPKRADKEHVIQQQGEYDKYGYVLGARGAVLEQRHCYF